MSKQIGFYEEKSIQTSYLTIEIKLYVDTAMNTSLYKAIAK
jgi:hypothetical protein